MIKNDNPKGHQFIVTFLLRDVGQVRKVYELLENENAPRWSAGQLNIAELKTAKLQTPQHKGDLNDITSRE